MCGGCRALCRGQSRLLSSQLTCCAFVNSSVFAVEVLAMGGRSLLMCYLGRNCEVLEYFLRVVQLVAHRLPSRVSRLELQMAPTTVRDHDCMWSFLLLFGVGVLLLLQIIYEYSGYLKPCSRLHFHPLSRVHSLLTNKSSEIIPALKIYSLLCTKSVIEPGRSERRIAENRRCSRR